LADPTLKKPDWLERGQLRWAWLSWEPLMFYQRVGGKFEAVQVSAPWLESWFHRLHSEEFIRKLADAGFNCVTTHFHKGFGMEAEAAEMEMTRRLIEICHRHGIRVLTYVQSMSIMYETFLKEVPHAERWLQKDEEGRHRTYGEQYWRLYPCLSEDEYVEYVRRVAAKAITWAKADGIHLDNTGFMVCQCDSCQEKFRRYLEARHPHPDKSRFGITDFTHVRVPVKGHTRDPLYQEAIRFRCDTLTAFIREIRQHVRELNPEAVVGANVTIDSPINFYDVYGVDYSLSARAADLVYAENGNFPVVVDDVLVTQIRYYKAGHATGAIIVPTDWLNEPAELWEDRLPENAEEVKRDMAEAAAYGRLCVGATWAARPAEGGRRTFLERDDVYDVVKRYNTFLRDHEYLYVGSSSLANVATFRNFPSLAFNYHEVYSSLVGYEQVLIQNHVPFEILFTEDLDRLEDFDCLILPNILCMSDEEARRIIDYVKAGGGLVATGRTSLFDGNFRCREDYALAEVFGVSSHPTPGADSVFRSGSVIFTPGVPEKVECNYLNFQTRPPLPERRAELLSWVREVCRREFPLEVEADAFVTTEICRAGDSLVVHLVNHRNSALVSEVALTLSSRFSVGTEARILSPDGEGEQTVEVRRDAAGRATVRVPALSTYSLVEFNVL